MATSLTLENDSSLAQGYIKVNGSTAATLTTSGITGNLTGNVTGNLTGSLTAGGSLTLATAQTASGTAVDFTGIPSWAKRITVMFNEVSASGTAFWALRVGTSSSVSVTGYSGSAGDVFAVNNTAHNSSTTEIPLQGGSPVSADIYNGVVTIVNLSGNIWSYSGNISRTATTSRTTIIAGTVTLSATLDRVRLTTVGGTDTFDAGTINISYEG